jgi:quercetin dioxygenase-like cupin family protein
MVEIVGHLGSVGQELNRRNVMSQSKLLLFAALIGAAAVGVPAAMPQSRQQDITRTEILRVPLAGLEGLDGIVYVADVPPGAVAPRHTHPGYEFNYVLAGSIFVEPDGEKPFTLTAGQATFLPRGHIHKVRNASATEPARVLTVLIHEIGKPLAVPVP